MAYIGSTPTSQSFTPGTDYFSGDGSTTAFTLTRSAVSINDLIVVIENVVQKPLDAYTVVGTTLTFTSAPPSGTNNIYVRYLSVNILSVAPNDLSVTTNKIADGVVTAAKMHTTAITDKLGYTPVNKAGDTISGYIEVGNTVRVTSISNPSSGSGMELAYDGTQGVIQVYSNRSALTSAPLYLGTGQLKFPASQIASGNPNTLDDYEEGLWTLTDASGSGVTFSVSTGPYYIKIGKLCFVNFYVSVNSTSSSNAITIGGFPFAADGGYCYLTGRVASAVSATPYVLQINAGQTTATMNSQIGAPGITWAQQSGNYWLFSGCYQTGS